MQLISLLDCLKSLCRRDSVYQQFLCIFSYTSPITHEVLLFFSLQACAGLFRELEEVLCDLRYIYAKCMHGLAVELMQDFQAYGECSKNVD